MLERGAARTRRRGENGKYTAAEGLCAAQVRAFD